ncbi:putative membrane protein [Vitis vinifera]|uniref:Putative membrane protein n=1 Tax=Vitis vinifera TaxID=29760 RepID=A0A438JZN4_VITVI|nr:putative membrane protein [Vitis vinifera]
MPASDYSFLKLPRSLEDIQILRSSIANLAVLVGLLTNGFFAMESEFSRNPMDHLEDYTSDYTVQVLVGYCMVYIFMQTFMIPGTVFMSLLAGSLFGVFKGVALSCSLQLLVAKRRERLLNYMLFLRVTPTLPNTFINVASPMVDVPYHIFFLATFIGLIPAAYVTVRNAYSEEKGLDRVPKNVGFLFLGFIQAGIALGELRSVGDLYDFQSIATLFLIGVVSVTPTLMSKNKS